MLLTFVLVPLLLCVGLSVDVIMLYLIKTRLSAAVDAGALAAARSFSRGQNIALQRSTATATAATFFRANFPRGFMGSSNSSPDPTVTVDESVMKVRTVTLDASVTAPLYFMSLLGPVSTVRAVGQASRRDVNLILVLDRSSSMGSAADPNSACSKMKNAARQFVVNFSEGRDRLGMIVFGGNYFEAFSPSVNFKTQSPPLDTIISQIACGDNTGTAQALWQGYQRLVNINEPGALNLILLFTDGLPNGVSADFNTALKGSSACAQKGPGADKVGWMAQWSGFAMNGTTAGIFGNVGISVSNAGSSVITTHSNGCAYSANQKNVRNDVASMPAQDIYGNATTGYAPVDLVAAVTSPYQLGQASKNAADNAATRIRNDTNLVPTIYCIGLGGLEPPDETLMRRISNDPLSPIYDDTKPAGLYVFAPGPDQLADAFARVASEILRLSM